MGSVFQREGAWVVKWRDATGAWCMKRTTWATKAEAKGLASDLKRAAERRQLGLEARPADSTMTLKELCEWWLSERRGPERSRKRDLARLETHVFDHPLASVILPRVTSERIEELLRGMEKVGAAPASVNRLRTALHAAFSRARKAKL